MTISTYRSPRGAKLWATNECFNPSLNASGQYWAGTGMGTGGAGTVGQVGDWWSQFDGGAFGFKWSNTPSSIQGCGMSYQTTNTNWNNGQQAYASIYAYAQFAANVHISARWFDSGGNLLKQLDGPVTAITANTSVRLGVGGTAPAVNVAQLQVWVFADFGTANPSPGQRFLVDGLMINVGASVLLEYFDGRTKPTTFQGLLVDHVEWTGPSDNSISNLYIVNPDTAIQPLQLADRHQYSQLSRNTVHTLMNGDTAATLMQGTKRRGVLKLLFDSSAAALNCSRQHMVPGTWGFADDENPAMAMNYVVTGGTEVSTYQDETRTLWISEIPFSETS